MKLGKISFFTAVLTAVIFGLNTNFISAQQNASWTQCTDGRVIVRCETYDCPLGDTNNDGRCTLTDDSARLTDARNDSFCANPLSGCGQVEYYPSSATQSCSTRVIENDNNCDLYAVAEPDFTPRPTSSPTVSSGTDTNNGVQCVSLTASPDTGKSPLEVTFTTTTRDPNNSIDEYEYVFTRNSRNVGTVIQSSPKITQTFDTIGDYTAKVTVIDDNSNRVSSSACETQVEVVNATTKGGGDVEDEKLPETGSEMWVGLGIVLLGAAGIYMYDRFRVI